ncbi:hypothetical protein [Corynebacterium ulcerans]|uniref:hypothetical protein n=1 Tax=Corynebacterium ulcerans TaxID=65058 RepID=UPI00051F731D|nr:hypothetical protein [Corynebacterium ulcerans]AIT89191.1 Hypothetical protein Cul210932_1245 [Corynebacterium ulcerans]ALD94967.1 Hypothetical protein Cul131001_1263 [Corynebacterium ulcerans]
MAPVENHQDFDELLYLGVGCSIGRKKGAILIFDDGEFVFAVRGKKKIDRLADMVCNAYGYLTH